MVEWGNPAPCTDSAHWFHKSVTVQSRHPQHTHTHTHTGQVTRRLIITRAGLKALDGRICTSDSFLFRGLALQMSPVKPWSHCGCCHKTCHALKLIATSFLGDLRWVARFGSFWKKQAKLVRAKSNHLQAGSSKSMCTAVS